jgi:hypothetical protein
MFALGSEKNCDEKCHGGSETDTPREFRRREPVKLWVKRKGISGSNGNDSCHGIREVMAFPKNNRGLDLMSQSPANVEPKQLRDLGIDLTKKDRSTQAPT